MAIESLPFRRQVHLTVGADKQRAAQLPLQIPNGAGDVGLAVQQRLRRLGKTAQFSYMVENPVVFVIDIHRILHIKLIFIHHHSIFYLSIHTDYNVDLVRSQQKMRWHNE